MTRRLSTFQAYIRIRRVKNTNPDELFLTCASQSPKAQSDQLLWSYLYPYFLYNKLLSRKFGSMVTYSSV